MLNIEEVLSLIEMESYVAGTGLVDKYKDYIKAVISHYTPVCKPKPDIKGTNYTSFYSSLVSEEYVNYEKFFLTLNGCRLIREQLDNSSEPWIYFSEPAEDNSHCYSIITVNYDLVIENIYSSINGALENDFKLNIDSDGPHISKLHGSLNSEIVMPTWNKRSSSEISGEWKKAYAFLKEANQIRILGYSLPQSDNYIKYLFAVAINASENLRNIDVITLDDENGSTEDRYSNFFVFPKLRFKNDSLENYLRFILQDGTIPQLQNHNRKQIYDFANVLENTRTGHEKYMIS